MNKKLLLFVLLTFSPDLYAFKFTPMGQTIRLNQDMDRVVFTIENDSESPMAIELKLKTREMLVDGSEKQNDLGENPELTIYPEQLIVPANQKRSVRVSWSGKKPPSYEKAFRVIAEQLPVELEENKSSTGIKMLLRYVAALYVNPGGQKSQVVLENFEIAENQLALQLHNKGGQHQVLNDMLIVAKHGDESFEFEASKIEGLQGENILAKTKRNFSLPLSGPLSGLSTQSKLRIEWDD